MRRLLPPANSLAISLIILIALLWPSFNSGLMITDFYHKALFLDRSPFPAATGLSLVGMFSFTSGDANRLQSIVDIGALPWWSLQDVKVSFFRPLAEVMHWLDYQWRPEQPRWMHVHNTLWYIAVAFAFASLVRRLYAGKSQAIPAIAIFLFVLSAFHAPAIVWIACRNTLMAAFFAITCFRLYLAGIDGKKSASVAAGAAFLLAILSGEYGLGVVPFLVSHALLADTRPWKHRIQSLAPILAIAVIYLGFYAHQGFGAQNSELYVNPHDTAIFLRAMLERVPAMIAAQLAGMTVMLFHQGSLGVTIMIGTACIMGVLMIPTLLRSREARFLTLGACGALLPVSSVILSDRVLLLSSVGFACLVAESLSDWASRVRADSGARRALAGMATGLLGLSHLVVLPLQFVTLYMMPIQLQELMLLQPINSLQSIDGIDGKRAILVNPPQMVTTCYYMPILFTRDAPKPASTFPLAPGSQPMDITRIDDNRLRISVPGGFLATADSWYPHPHKSAFSEGQRFNAGDTTITIEHINASGNPDRALFSFAKPLDHADHTWLIFVADGAGPTGHYQRWTLPATGETVTLAPPAPEK